jgi:hypothetical protein
MTLEVRMNALLDLVLADRARRCEAILGEARQRAAATLATANAQARRRVRDTFDEERRRLVAGVAAARASLETHRRLHDQRRAKELLAAGLESLPQALRMRWQRREMRQAWIGGVVNRARDVLPRGTWCITHAPGLTGDERKNLSASIESVSGEPPRFVADDALGAGIKIAASGNVVDATLAGLLADRVEIGASLLVHFEADA